MTTVNAAVIHRLLKDRHLPATISTRKELLPEGDEPTLALIADIQKLYLDKANKGLGHFNQDEVNFPTSAVLRQYFEADEIDFLAASQTLMSTLSSRATSVGLATGGFVLMAHVTDESATDWFIVAIATNVKGTAVNEDTYAVIKSMHVDLQNLRIAGRVNISEWLENKPGSRYVGFLKQKGGLSEYFRLFLGCDEFVERGPETRKLLGVLQEFATAQSMNDVERETFIKAAHDYGIQCEATQQPLSLDALCNLLRPDDPDALRIAFTSAAVQIADGFVPDKRVLKSFVRYKAKTKFWSVDVAREAFSSGHARYDEDLRALVLSNLPAELEAELIRDTVNENGQVQ